MALGNGPRSTRVTLIFWEREATPEDDAAGFAADDHVTRFTTFWATALGAQEPLEFVHPLFGPFQAWVEEPNVSANAEDRNVLAVECVMVEDSTTPSVLLDGTVIAPYHSSTQQAAVFSRAFDDEIAALGLDDESSAVGLGEDVRTTMDTWSADPSKNVRDVNGDLSRLTDKLDDALRDIDYATNLDRIPLLRTSARLHGSIRRAAEAFKKTAPQLVEHVVLVGQPLDAIILGIYGSRQLDRRRDEMLKLNDVADPGFVPAGTKLQRVLDNAAGVTGLNGFRGRVAR
jgi:hypothetical protein